MDDSEIKENLGAGLNLLMEHDAWLIQNDLSEQSITHKLAGYLQQLFLDWNVDCEYNGNVDDPRAKKQIWLIKDKLLGLGILKEIEALDEGNEITQRAVFPDIIIHSRGTNDSNLCIVEVKKNTSRVPYDYDYLKLCAYTENINGNSLGYQLGVFVLVTTGQDIGFEIKYFKGGVLVEDNG